MIRAIAPLLLGALIACGSAEPPPTEPAPAEPARAQKKATPPAADPERVQLRTNAAAIFGVLPDEVPNEYYAITPAMVKLGRMLYYDTRLSKNHDLSCNSCHKLDAYGVDGEPTSPGHKGQRGERNSPTVYNAALHIAQFWDGRAADVEEQAKGPILNPIEMGAPSEETVVAVLKSIPGYAPLFATAFPSEKDPVSYHNMASAIGAFERRLTTPSRFDAFLEGRHDALSDEEVAGLQTFMAVGCIQCHIGPAVGGGSYQKLGRNAPYATEDPGRFNVTGKESDRHVFKVPSLRNIAKTGPYFHDGSITSLDEAVALMGTHQLSVELSRKQRSAILAFLGSLTGDVDQQYIEVPELPESGPNTPEPDPT